MGGKQSPSSISSVDPITSFIMTGSVMTAVTNKPGLVEHDHLFVRLLSAEFGGPASSFLDLAETGSTGLNPSGDFTIELWAKWRSLPAANEGRALVSKWSGGATADPSSSYKLDHHNDGADSFLRLSLTGTLASISVQNSFTPDKDRWYHITTRFRPSVDEVIFTVDGVALAGGLGDPGQIVAGDVNFEIGRSGSDGSTFEGRIDDVRFWDMARAVSVISGNMKTHLIGTETNLQGYWKLDNDSLDLTSNNNDLTQTGSGLFEFSPDSAF